MLTQSVNGALMSQTEEFVADTAIPTVGNHDKLKFVGHLRGVHPFFRGQARNSAESFYGTNIGW